MTLSGKNVLIGITGGISAYKICSLVRMFKKNNAAVKVVMTPNALEFVGAKTFETLSENEVFIDQFAPKTSTKHISLADWADLFVIAPLTANTLGKFANGICDNLLTSLFCASFGKKIPMVLVPAMNDGMWNNVFVAQNLEKLSSNGCKVIEPETGFLACGTEGTGRLPCLENILNICVETLNSAKPDKLLNGKRIIITAGGTREYIDPVRFIGNSSSGKMGISLANAALELGAQVELICTFEPDFETAQKCKITRVESAITMQEAVERAFPDCDCLIMAAAVADFRPKEFSDSKITKEKIGESENLTLELVKNPDILKNIALKKRENQTIIGFCLSTENVVENAKRKLSEKKCDYIIANEARVALGNDDSEVWIIDKNQNVRKIERDSKPRLAKKILELVYGRQ